ncbi:MAG: hypothetical protein WBE25_01360, partial [Xanthobacteraceae bacterium]
PSFALASRFLLTFGVLRTNVPRFSDLHQHFSIFVGGALRQPPALGGVVAKFLGVFFGIILSGIHLVFRIAVVPMFHVGNPWNLGKVPVQIHALNGTICSLRRSPPVRWEAVHGEG